MTAHEALQRATEIGKSARLQTYQTVCGSCAGCRLELLEQDAGRWTYCPDCATIYDDFAVPVNPLSARQLSDAYGASTTH